MRVLRTLLLLRLVAGRGDNYVDWQGENCTGALLLR